MNRVLVFALLALAELALIGLNYPADLSYDPATGTVRSQTYPSY